ncbi:MAG: dTDP-4-dehydrorhamnose 3,5-epimerase [Crocinitomicaceae bacterium]|nr:dTDP-4-dehydrorhamnose 3,5-epimerase [Crocinitomicaceae bacterium]
MKVERTSIEGLLILVPRVFSDDRGSFFESFNQGLFNEFIGEQIEFVQDNQSISSKNVLRGLHFQNPPYAQGKLVRVIKGSVIDVAVDIRKDSATYGQHVAVELSEKNNKQFWIPPGFAHGFLALEDDTIFAYKCTNNYSPSSEGCLLWNDSDIKIDWNIDNPIVSLKDEEGEEFCNFVSQF